MEGTTSNFGDIIAFLDVFEFNCQWSVFFQGNVTESELPVFACTTSQNFASWCQVGGMLEAAVYLDDLIWLLEPKVDGSWQMLARHADAKSSVLGLAPAIYLSSDINCYGMCTAGSNLNYALERWDELRLSDCLQTRIFLTKTEDSELVASHWVDITILREQVGVSLTARNLLDEDVVATHFR